MISSELAAPARLRADIGSRCARYYRIRHKHYFELISSILAFYERSLNPGVFRTDEANAAPCFHPRPQRAWFNSGKAGGAVETFDLSVSELEGIQQIATLHFAPLLLPKLPFGLLAESVLPCPKCRTPPGAASELRGPASAQNEGSIEDVLQLTHIAGPFVRTEGFDGRSRHIRDGHTQTLRRLLQEVVNQRRQIFFPVAQGRHLNREDTEAVIQVLKKAAFADGFREVVIRGGNYPDVDLMGLVVTDRFEPAGRENALRKLGVHPRVLKTVRTGRGAWFMAATSSMHAALKSRTLRRYGFLMPSDLAAI